MNDMTRYLFLACVLLACDAHDPILYSGQFADSTGGMCGGGGSTASCCPATPGQTGCADKAVEHCVCVTHQQGSCCSVEWDQDCEEEVFNLGCTSLCGSGGQGGAAGDGGSAGSGGGLCCPATPGVTGCATDPAVENCVCNTHADSICCTVEWDEDCSEEVFNLGCASLCGQAGTGGGGTGGTSGLTCCPAHDGPGCDDPVVEACVCQPPFSDSRCCTVEWDENCEEEARETYCQCGAGPQPPSPDQGDCCETTTAVGCTDRAIEACVCADPDGASCCTSAPIGWDSFCVDLVTDLGCGTCPR